MKPFWHLLRRPSTKCSLLTLLVLGFVGGILFWGAFNTGMEATNTMALCTGCHEMRATVYVEYQETVHFKNRSGVRAVCPDCHVPRDWTHKMVRKVQASGEVWGKLTGRIATHKWTRMAESGSRECRNGHNFDTMSGEKQKQSVFKKLFKKLLKKH